MTRLDKKRKTSPLTADDLMRLAEQTPHKRQKVYFARDNEDSAEDTEHTDSDDDNSASEGSSQTSEVVPTLSPDDDVGDTERISSRLLAHRARSPKVNAASRSSLGFAALGVSQPLITALSMMAIRQPTDVQTACIPPLLAGRDCIGNAKTGSGKTIAFALPIIHKLSMDPYGIFALVLTPTRELAFQIADQFTVLGGTLGIRTAVIVGGMDMMAQAIELCNRPHVVIATPGRMVDHLNSSSNEWDLSRVKFLVLDEADRLLQSTFASELATLMKAIPQERQTCLFTATLTPAIEALAAAPPRVGKQSPYVYRMEGGVETVSTLTQLYVLVPSHVREVYLYHLLRNVPESTIPLRRAAPEPVSKRPQKSSGKAKKAKSASDVEPVVQPPPTIIFTARARTAAYLTAMLQTLSIRTTSLHSRLTQRDRLNNLNLFKSYVVPVLVTTDVGARGLDIDDVAMVINWDLPQEPEEYTHRVGRTARAGKGGVSISFVTERDEEKVLKIEDRIKTKLEEMKMPEEKVLDNLNAVFSAKRLANMELHDSEFGKREEIRKIKQAKKDKAVKPGKPLL